MGLYNQLVHLGHSTKNMRSSLKRRSLDKKFYKKNKDIFRWRNGFSVEEVTKRSKGMKYRKSYDRKFMRSLNK